jgi:thiamine biosynthesis lipoprotein
VTVIGTSLTAVDIDATAAYALGPDAVGWPRTRPHSALVVHTDGTTTVVDASSSR